MNQNDDYFNAHVLGIPPPAPAPAPAPVEAAPAEAPLATNDDYYSQTPVSNGATGSKESSGSRSKEKNEMKSAGDEDEGGKKKKNSKEKKGKKKGIKNELQKIEKKRSIYNIGYYVSVGLYVFFFIVVVILNLYEMKIF